MKSFYNIRFMWAVAILFTLVFSACQKDLDDQTYQQDEISNDLKYNNGGGYSATMLMSFNPGMT